ncbi:hypothetical protein LZP69_10640 [Shewanella sp. AS1]|uniref:hypothetical protein n=1 Tax=Shewanella sp. AS1 TaxID=2907626 RepID=UPI001F3F6833|nr:hypothetical protein [Shewanella sp. AS1]MCE9679617.1 hypothetical protein [Shewanella sp. AS1]
MRTPTSKAEQRQLDKELQLLGIEDKAPEEDAPIVFWDEHEAALNWWWQVQDLLRYNECVCMGLDVLAVKADSELSGREVSVEDYQKLRLIAHTVTELFNDKLTT